MGAGVYRFLAAPPAMTCLFFNRSGHILIMASDVLSTRQDVVLFAKEWQS